MSEINLTPLLPDCQAKVVDQYVIFDKKVVNVVLMPDERYNPICSKCRAACKKVHSYTDRDIRDLNVFDFKTNIVCCYRKVRCPNCGITVEDIGITEPGVRITKRLAEYIVILCHFMAITDVARHLSLDWKTVKEVHKKYLLHKFSNENFGRPRILVVDEIAIHKGHKYLTVVIDWDSKKVLWIGKDRRLDSLKRFYSLLSDEQKKGIKAVAMDMWKPFVKATLDCLPNTCIVFDQFHMLNTFSKIIDKIRVAEYMAASKEDKEIIKGSRYLLLKNSENLHEEEKSKLNKILAINKNITTTLILKDLLKKLWSHRHADKASEFLEYWCHLALDSGIKYLKSFVKTLQTHAHGILSHCMYPIHTSIIEGFNNKIKLIKRKAYGFNDMEYFTLVVKEAFFSN